MTAQTGLGVLRDTPMAIRPDTHALKFSSIAEA